MYGSWKLLTMYKVKACRVTSSLLFTRSQEDRVDSSLRRKRVSITNLLMSSSLSHSSEVRVLEAANAIAQSIALRLSNFSSRVFASIIWSMSWMKASAVGSWRILQIGCTRAKNTGTRNARSLSLTSGIAVCVCSLQSRKIKPPENPCCVAKVESASDWSCESA